MAEEEEVFGCWMNRGCDGNHWPDEDPSTVGKKCNDNNWKLHGEGDSSVVHKRKPPLKYEDVFDTNAFSKGGKKFLMNSRHSGRTLNQNRLLKKLRVHLKQNPAI